jgi:A/G-specific adenine glycosylase
MLQQTRVAAVLPYYERFVERFPTIQHLAAAREDDVLHAWSGLGYYSRARNMLKAASLIAATGDFPNGYYGIRALPGIGDYTASAVASIAFHLPHAAIDGNALRVLGRMTAEPGDIGSLDTRKRLAAIANQWLDRTRPGDFNQAVMELGATMCLARSPECAKCPLSRYCRGYQEGVPEHYPVKRLQNVQRQEVTQSLFYIERRGKVLLWRRDADSKRLAGFWELPGGDQLRQTTDQKKAGEFRHTIVNTTFCFRVMRASIGVTPRGLVWLPKNSLHELPLSTTAKKAMLCLYKGSQK